MAETKRHSADYGIIATGEKAGDYSRAYGVGELKTKVCSRCKREVPATLEHFYADKRLRSGLRADCKDCCKITERESIARREYRSKNKDRSHLRAKAWYEKNKEYILKHRSDRYRKEEEVKNRHREWLKNWRKNNSEKNQIYKLTRRTIESKLPSTLTPEEWIECKDYFNNKCAYCGKQVVLTVDHFIPLNKKGELSKENVIPACGSCNSSKCATLFEFWYPRQPFYSKQREQKILNYLGYKNGVQQLSIL